MIKAILFDCFGVLYPDTYWTMASEFLGASIEDHRAELHDLVRQVDLGHITRDELWGHFAEIVGKPKSEVYDRLDEFTGLDKRLLQFIEENKSHYKFGMISNVGHGFIERMFREKPAEHYFDALVLSSDVGLVKPDARIYEMTAEQLGVNTDECVFIDDIERNVDGARKTGMEAIHYTDYHQAMNKLQAILY